MSNLRKAEVAAAILFLLAAGVFARGWLLERDARVRAETAQKANEQIVAAKAAAIQNRDAVDAAYAKLIAQQQSGIKTAQQAAQVIVRYLPAPKDDNGAVRAQAPVTVVQANELSAELQQKLPASPSYGVLTESQLKDVAANDLTCDATSHTLATCKADAADLHAQIAAKDAEVNAWQNAAKGGSKWQRFGHALKLIGCGAAGAAAGSSVAALGPANSLNVAAVSAAGAAGGVTVCSLF